MVSIGRRNGTVEAYSFIIPDVKQRASKKLMSKGPRKVTQKVTEMKEQEPNDDSSHANEVSLPVTISGKISKTEERDHFLFEARAGEPRASAHAAVIID